MKYQPKIEYRVDQPYLGIRTQVPMKKMKKVIPVLNGELFAWMREKGIQVQGAPILRYHVINMEGLMDIEVGVPVAGEYPGATLSNGDQIQPGVLPAGRYAALVFTGANNGIKGNGALLDWGAQNGLTWDRWDVPAGDAFRSRYETYLTDPADEPDLKKWQIEVAIRIKDAPV